MADFMTVLAASQKQATGGKPTNLLASLLPEGLFGSVLSAKLDPSLDVAALPALPPALPAALADGLSAPIKPGGKKAAVEADTNLTAEAQVAVLPAIIDKNVGQRAQLEEVRPSAAGVSRDPMAAASSAGSGVARGQELPVVDRPRLMVGSEGASVATVSAATASAATAATPLLAAATDTPLDASPATDMTGVHAARHLGQFEQVVRAPESRVQVALETPVRGQAFPAEFSEKVVWLAGRQSQWADMSLNPPQLGAIEVRLSLSGGEAGAQFFSPHPAVRDAIEAALPRLRELMAQAGIALGDAQVRDEAFARRESGASNQNGGGNANPGETAFPGAPIAMHTRAGLGLVDLYV
ncbi:MAG: flagellar hook-length control protein FliK [Gallionellaceae bacterium]|nr:flagellar hook-length control protein FliK [Gallionellaceae bacterium]